MAFIGKVLELRALISGKFEVNEYTIQVLVKNDLVQHDSEGKTMFKFSFKKSISETVGSLQFVCPNSVRFIQ